MIPVLTRSQMREFDRYAIQTCHVPGVVLMENAGRGAADVIAAMIDARRERRRSPLARELDVRLVPGEETPTMLLRSTATPLPGAHGVHGVHGQSADDARLAAKKRDFPVRHVPSPGQPAAYPLDARVVVVCGAGNNGGDGFVVARHLLARGAEVEVFLAGSSEKVMGDSRINHDAYIDLGGEFVELPQGASLAPLAIAIERADFVVDAIFGTGLDRPIQGHLADVILAINGAQCRCIALDVPSGLDADSGAPFGVCVQADETVTFGHLKIGLLTPEGARLAGNVHVVDLGVPDPPILAHVGHVAEVIRRENVGASLTAREPNVYKHQAGDVLVIAGSEGKPGAALLAARGAIRAGAGLVTVCTWPDAARSIESRMIEIMTTKIDPGNVIDSIDHAIAKRKAVAIGPGLGLDQRARTAVDHVVLNWDGVKVVDADAITHFVDRAHVLSRARGQCILTPHAGELGRLLGRTAKEIESDRFGAVREAVKVTGAIVVLKGARTIIATPDAMHICMAGNPALATAGSGDVLTGIIAALACNLAPEQATCAGVLIHALAGDRWRARTGCDRGLIASEIAEMVPTIIAALSNGTDPFTP